MNTEKTSSRTTMSKGFTLIELMIGIAIIGVLSAIAIPAFQDYLNRSKVVELMNLAQACKTGVVEFAATHNRWPTTAAEAGCQSGVAANSKYAQGLFIDGSGRIRVTFKDNEVVEGLGLPNHISLVPWSGTGRHTSATAPIGQWRCVTSVTGEFLRFIPAACRNPNAV